MALKNAIKIDASAPQSGARVISPAGCQQRQASSPGTFNPQSCKSHVIEMPLTADAAIRAWRPLAARLASEFVKKYSRPDYFDDLESEGLEAIAAALRSYDPSHNCSWVGWAELRIRWAMSKWIDKELHPRRQYPIVAVELDPEQESQGPAVDDLVDSQILNEEIQAAISELSNRQQKIVELVYSRGMTVVEAAGQIGVGRTTASGELKSAIRQIRCALKF